MMKMSILVLYRIPWLQWKQKQYVKHSLGCNFNPFLDNVSILYPLETPEIIWLFGCLFFFFWGGGGGGGEDKIKAFARNGLLVGVILI